MVGCAVNRGGLLFLGLAAISASAGALAQPAAGQNPPYRIVNGKVDEATFRGWLVYHSACHTCHGIDAIGTEVAPSLVERVKDLSASSTSMHTFAHVPMGRLRLACPRDYPIPTREIQEKRNERPAGT
jgi:mono/diheme cytochrome c family protein